MPPENLINITPTNNQQSPVPNSTPPQTTYPAVVTPAGVGIQINNVSQSMWQYIRKRKLVKLLLFVPIVVIWEFFAIIFFVSYMRQTSGSDPSGGRGFMYMILAPIIIF